MKTSPFGRLAFLCLVMLASVPAMACADDDEPNSRALRAMLQYILGILEQPREAKKLTQEEEREQAKLQKRLYSRLKKTGGINDPHFPYVVYVKAVDGKKLRSVEFMRRDASGKKFDLVGRAEEAEVRVDLATGHLLIRTLKLEVKCADGSSGFFLSQIWPVPLPGDRAFLIGRRANLPMKDDLPLSAEQRKFLADAPYDPNSIPVSPAAPAPAPSAHCVDH